jgi:putative peptidoglycan lipid II flippase
MVKATAHHHKHWGGRTFRFSLGSFRFDRNFSMRRFSITEAALLLLTAYIASKGLGVIRQVLFNSLFGTGPAATAYYAAFRLPDTIFNLIAGGALTHAFIPVLFSYEKERGRVETWRLTSLVFNVLLVSLVAIVLLAEFIAPIFVNNLLVPGLPPYERDLTTTLTRIMLIQPLILGLGTIATAILHSKRQFFPSALAVTIYNLGPIGGLLLARAIPGVGIYGPTYGLLATALCQVAVQIPGVIKQGARYTSTWDLKNPGLSEVLRLLGPNVLNVMIVSAGAIVVTSFASYLPDKSSIAAMHNAFMLFAIPLTLVSQTIGNALLPQITMQATQGRYVRMSWTILKIVGGATLLSVLAAILLNLLGKPAIHILFQHGAFNEHASTLTHLALIGYSVGLPGQVVSLLIIVCFYAIKDVRTPLFANVAALALQIGLSLFLLKVLKGTYAILGLPLAASLTGTTEALLLCLILFIRLRARVKTDKGMHRLQQRRKQFQALQEAGRIEHLLAPYSPVQARFEHQPAQPIAAYQPQAEAPYQPAVQPQQVTERLSVSDYQRLVLLDPDNLAVLVQWHVAMMTSPDIEPATILEGLARICRQLHSDEGQHNYEMVMRAYNQVSESYPYNTYVHFALGQIHQQLGNYDKAIDAYLRAMRNSTLEVMARFSIAQCLLFQDKPEVAVEQLEQVLQNVRHSSSGSINPGVWAARPRQDGEEHLAPEVEISMLLANAYRHTGRQEDTHAVLRQVKHVIVYQGEVFSTALAVPQENGANAVRDNAPPLDNYRSSNQAAGALNALHEIVPLTAQAPESHDELASIYIKRGLLNEAIAELRDLAIIQLRNNQLQQAGATVRRIGKIHAEVGDMEEALTYLRHAVELVPDDLGLLHEIVGYYVQLGRTKDAAHYQEMIALHYFDTHQDMELLAALQQLIALERNNYEAYDMLGQTYQSLGQHEQAIWVYKNLAKVDPGSSLARERLAALQDLQRASGTNTRISLS